MDSRSRTRELAEEHLARGDALGWFEALYKEAGENFRLIPWADLVPNPNLLEWLRRPSREGQGKAALVVGCGLGDDAEELARRGFRVTAFDIAPTAIAMCRRRFSDSPVDYAVANLFDPPERLRNAFDFVFESNTLQALRADIRGRAIEMIASFVAPAGQLLVIARGRGESDPPGEMPWPLTRTEILEFQKHGLALLECEDFLDRESPPIRRFRASFQKPR